MTDYAAEAEGAVAYFPVTLGAVVVGYLWASEDDRAADFFRNLAADEELTLDAYFRWRERISESKASGLSPLQMIHRWRGVAEDAVAGGISADAEVRRAESLRELSRLADPENREPSEWDEPSYYDGPPLVELGPVGYSPRSDTTVRYLPVAVRNEEVGFLWASDDARAAGFVQWPGSGAVGFDAASHWESRLREARTAGLSPVEALRRWRDEPEDQVGGRVPIDAVEREAPNSDRLHRIAARAARKRG